MTMHGQSVLIALTIAVSIDGVDLWFCFLPNLQKHTKPEESGGGIIRSFSDRLEDEYLDVIESFHTMNGSNYSKYQLTAYMISAHMIGNPLKVSAPVG